MLLEIKHLTKSFHGQQVLKGLDLSVNAGDATVILGPSGAGKTTLLRCMNFLETADGGEITFDGKTRPIAEMSKREIRAYRMHTAFVFQSFNLFLNKNALATDPEIIFFDEPTSALDPELTGEVLSVMRSLAADGMTMLIVTHEIEFARTVSNRIVFMEDGEILDEGETKRVFTHPEKERTAAFLKINNDSKEEET